MELNARFLATPIAPHYVRMQTRNQSNKGEQLKPLHPEQLFTSHFLYQHAVIADTDSDWTNILPSIDFVIINQNASGLQGCSSRTATIGGLMAENAYFRRSCSEIGLDSQVDSSVQVIMTGVKEFILCVQASFLKKRNVIYLFPWFGPCSIIPNGCPFYRDIIHASPFRVPEKLLTNQTFHNLQECISIHIRLVDRKTTCDSTLNYSVAGDMVKHCTTTVNSVP